MTRAAAALLDLATPDLYRRNSFRILELPVDADQKAVTRRLDVVVRSLDRGLPVAPGPQKLAPLAEEVDTHRAQAAAHALAQMPERIAHEFFWLWPLQGAAAGDPALSYFAAGNAAAALDAWQARASDPAAGHNLAVYHHLSALDMEHARRTPGGNARGGVLSEETIARTWELAFVLWSAVISDNALWNALKHRISALGDPALPADAADEMRTALPVVLARITFRLAIEAYERGEKDRARAHIARLRASKLPAAAIENAARQAAAPTRDSLETLRKTSPKAVEAAPLKGDGEIDSFLGKAAGLLDVLDLLIPPGAVRDAEQDQVASATWSMLHDYAKESKNWKRTKELALRGQVFAKSGEIRQRLSSMVTAMDENLADLLCWFCGVNKPHKPSELKVPMFGDVQRDYSGVRWRHVAVPINRCEACAKADKSEATTGCVGFALAVAGAVIAWNYADDVLGEPVEGFMQFALAAGGLVVGVVLTACLSWMWNKPAKKRPGGKVRRTQAEHPLVKELKRQGWEFGEKPST